MNPDLSDAPPARVEVTRFDVDALEARLVEAEVELAAMYELELALKSATEERDAVRLELAAVRQDAVDLRASTSWRVTAPLRRLSELLARKRRV